MTIKADMWGWVKRRRLFWLACNTHQRKEHNLATVAWETIPLPDGFTLVRSDSAAVAAEVKGTTKQWPSTVLFEDGFATVFAPGDAGRKFHPFTREFRHPTDRVKQASPEAADRFYDDHQRFPPAAYERESLLWRQEEWRTPTPAERAQLHGLPPSHLQPLQAKVGA